MEAGTTESIGAAMDIGRVRTVLRPVVKFREASVEERKRRKEK